MNTFFTADLHFQHANAIKYCHRPFATADEMDEVMIDNWNSVVSPKDHIWILGDVSFTTEEKTNALLKRLKGKKHLVLGNHDRRFTKSALLQSHFAEIVDLKELKIDNQHIVMCHYPMLSWNRSHHGSLHLHGHTHGGIPYDKTVKRIDVGVDVWDFAPVEYSALQNLISVV